MDFDIANLAFNIGQSNPKDWVDIFSALLTPIVAIFAGIIAYQQWQTQEKQRKQELFEMRYDNLFKVVLENTNRYNMYKKEKFEKIDFKEKEKLDEEFRLKLHKYKFLITKKDFNRLIEIYAIICSLLKAEEKVTKKRDKKGIGAVLKDIDNYFNKMDEILEKYLRVETESFNFFDFLSKLFKGREKRNDL